MLPLRNEILLELRNETRNEQKSRVGLAVLTGLVKGSAFGTGNAGPSPDNVVATGGTCLALLSVPRWSLLGTRLALLSGGIK